jgi:hypothetical protein
MADLFCGSHTGFSPAFVRALFSITECRLAYTHIQQPVLAAHDSTPFPGRKQPASHKKRVLIRQKIF